MGKSSQGWCARQASPRTLTGKGPAVSDMRDRLSIKERIQAYSRRQLENLISLQRSKLVPKEEKERQGRELSKIFVDSLNTKQKGAEASQSQKKQDEARPTKVVAESVPNLRFALN